LTSPAIRIFGENFDKQALQHAGKEDRADPAPLKSHPNDPVILTQKTKPVAGLRHATP
jgi:hypothetical protein